MSRHLNHISPSGRMVRVHLTRTYLFIKECCMDLSLRARAYLWSYTLANLAMGVTLVTMPASFQSQSFDAVRAVCPLWVWGMIYLCVAVVTFWGAYRGTERPARLGLLANLITTGGFFAAFVVASVQNTSSSPSGPIAWGLLAVINLIMLANPLRTPFEDLVKEMTEERD